MAQSTATCMFCGAPGVTKAHVFAQGFTKLFDRPGEGREHRVAHHRVDPSSGEAELLKRAKTFALVGRKVCGGCNNGWLSELEQRVTPTMACFATDSPFVLDASEQADLALWATATALIAMRTDPDATDFASAGLARSLWAHRRPPDGTQVWLGANTHGEMGWFGSHSLTFPRAPEQTGGWGATPCLGYGVMHIVHHGLPHQRMRLRHDALRALRAIWPTQYAVRWPPPKRMTVRDLSPLAFLVGEQSSFERAA